MLWKSLWKTGSPSLLIMAESLLKRVGTERGLFPRGNPAPQRQQKSLVRLKVKSGPTISADGEGKTWRDWAHCGSGQEVGSVWKDLACQCKACTEPTAFWSPRHNDVAICYALQGLQGYFLQCYLLFDSLTDLFIEKWKEIFWHGFLQAALKE